MKKLILFTLAMAMTISFSSMAFADLQLNNKASVEKFFRPSDSSQLRARLPSRAGNNDNASFISDSSCPDDIFIGSVQDGSNAFGNPDIDVNIGGDIIINCGIF